MVLLISYDLNSHERPSSYESVRAVIARYAASARKPLYSQWLVETEDDPQLWSDRIRAVADSDDGWFVVRVQRPYQGWLPREIWDWLGARV
jgi:hypothetical protein